MSGQVFHYGIATGRCERDLSADLRGALTPHDARNQAAVTPDELPALIRAIATWIVPAECVKMRTEHIVPLSRDAVEVLNGLRTTGADSRYVFPGRNPDKPISNNTMLFALYRLGYKGKMTGHGFRAIASTI